MEAPINAYLYWVNIRQTISRPFTGDNLYAWSTIVRGGNLTRFINLSSLTKEFQETQLYIICSAPTQLTRKIIASTSINRQTPDRPQKSHKWLLYSLAQSKSKTRFNNQGVYKQDMYVRRPHQYSKDIQAQQTYTSYDQSTKDMLSYVHAVYSLSPLLGNPLGIKPAQYAAGDQHMGREKQQMGSPTYLAHTSATCVPTHNEQSDPSTHLSSHQRFHKTRPGKEGTP